MSMVKVLAMRILTEEVTDIRGQLKAKVEDIANVGCDGLGSNMAIVPLVHAKYESSLKI